MLETLLKSKTLKREYALALVSILTWKIYEGDQAMVEAIIWPILTFAAGVAGIHMAWTTKTPNEANASVGKPVEEVAGE